MDNRRYVKRIWRVPKHRGALEYFATLVTKALVKHGWPAAWEAVEQTDGFVIYIKDRKGAEIPPDMAEAIAIASRVTARAYNLEAAHWEGWIGLLRCYIITQGGQFREDTAEYRKRMEQRELSRQSALPSANGGAPLRCSETWPIQKHDPFSDVGGD